ncbi:MAG: hypothetical protein ACRYGP_13675 [Janthinobacterium lividum]
MSAVVTSAVPFAASAGPFLTGERFAVSMPWVLALVFVLMVIGFVWVDRGKPWVADDDADPFWHPPQAVDLDEVEARLRAADRG